MEDGPLSPRAHLDPTVLNLPRPTSCRLRLQLWKEERFLLKSKRLRKASQVSNSNCYITNESTPWRASNPLR